MDYLIDEDNPIKINFLKDYSEFLLTYKLYDEKIINWQIENKDSLITLGLDMNTLKKVSENFCLILQNRYFKKFTISLR